MFFKKDIDKSSFVNAIIFADKIYSIINNRLEDIKKGKETPMIKGRVVYVN